MTTRHHNPNRPPQRPRRDGAVLVEFAVVVPVFAIFMAGIIEFGHAYLVIGTLNAAARGAARYGTVEDITTAQVQDEAERILGSAFNEAEATIRVKDAAVFDQASFNPESINYAGLPDVEVNSLDTGDMFLVRIEVPYADVAIMPPFWTQSLTLRAQSVVRHE
jgi:Flp pilus assembly protein TadG